MEHEELTALATALETGDDSNPHVAAQVLQALREMRTDTEQTPLLDEAALSSTDAAISLACRLLTGWEIRLQGLAVEDEGRWVCSLRQGTARDDDEVIGIGKARSAGHAVLAALLIVAARHKRGYV